MGQVPPRMGMTRPETRVRDLVLVRTDQRVAWRGNRAPADPAGSGAR